MARKKNTETDAAVQQAQEEETATRKIPVTAETTARLRQLAQDKNKLAVGTADKKLDALIKQNLGVRPSVGDFVGSMLRGEQPGTGYKERTIAPGKTYAERFPERFAASAQLAERNNLLNSMPKSDNQVGAAENRRVINNYNRWGADQLDRAMDWYNNQGTNGTVPAVREWTSQYHRQKSDDILNAQMQDEYMNRPAEGKQQSSGKAWARYHQQKSDDLLNDVQRENALNAVPYSRKQSQQTAVTEQSGTVASAKPALPQTEAQINAAKKAAQAEYDEAFRAYTAAKPWEQEQAEARYKAAEERLSEVSRLQPKRDAGKYGNAVRDILQSVRGTNEQKAADIYNIIFNKQLHSTMSSQELRELMDGVKEQMGNIGKLKERGTRGLTDREKALKEAQAEYDEAFRAYTAAKPWEEAAAEERYREAQERLEEINNMPADETSGHIPLVNYILDNGTGVLEASIRLAERREKAHAWDYVLNDPNYERNVAAIMEDHAESTEAEDPVGYYLRNADIIDAQMQVQGADNRLTWKNIPEAMLKQYYAVLDDGGVKEAMKFIQANQNEIDNAWNTEQQGKTAERYNSAGFWGKLGMNAASVPQNVMGSVIAAGDDFISGITGRGLSSTNIYHRARNEAGEVRSLTAEDLTKNIQSPVWKDIIGNAYQAGMSGLDSAFGATLFGNGYTMMMAAGAGAQQAEEMYERGESPEKIVAGTIAVGAAEAFFEDFSIEKFTTNYLKGNIKGFRDYIGKTLVQAGTEASEEFATEIADKLADAIISGANSANQEKIRQYYAQYGDMEKAKAMAAIDAAMDVFWATYGGAISGGAMGGTAGAVNWGVNSVSNSKAVNNQRAGRAVMANNTQEYNAIQGVVDSATAAKEAAGQDGKAKINDKLLKLAQEKAKMTYDQIRNQGALRKMVTAQQVGKLLNQTIEAQTETAKGKEMQQFQAAAQDQLESRGVANAKEAAQALAKQTYGEQLTAQEAETVEDIRNTDEIIQAVEDSQEFQEFQKQNVEPLRQSYLQTSDRESVWNPANVAEQRAIVAEAAEDSGNTAMLDHFQEGQDAESYVRGWEAAYEFGANGIDQRYALSASETAGLTRDQIITAHEAGARSATNGEGNLRQGEKWNDRANSGRQVPGVEESTGAGQASGQQAQSGIVTNAAGQVTRPQIPNGVNNEHLVQVAEQDYTADEKAAVAHAKKHGVECVIVRGDAIKTSVTVNGEKRLIRARAMIEGNTMWVRGDDPSFTAEQIANHEAGHKQIERGEVSIDETIKKLREKYTEKQLKEIVDLYAQAYGDSGLTAAEIMEEIVCDSLGQMNAFAVNSGSTVAGRVGIFLRSVRQAAKDSGQTQKTTAENSGGVKFSIENTINMTWDKQIKSALSHKGEVKRSDTLVVLKNTPGYIINKGTEDIPLAIPLGVITKAQKGRNENHTVSNKSLIELNHGIKNAVAVIDNPERNSIGFITPLIEPSGNVCVFFNKGQTINGRKVHQATTIHTRESIRGLLNNSADGSVVYVKNKNEFDRLAENSDAIPEAYTSKIKFVWDNVAQQEKKVKQQFSRDVDVTQSKQFREWFGQSKAVDEEGKPMVLYHQTDADFTVFDLMREGAGTRDQDTPFGIFMKSSDRHIGLRGEKQMPLYASLQNPLEVRNREDLRYQLRRMSDDYVMLTAEHEKLDREYKQKHEEAGKAITEYMTKWRKEHPEASRRALWDDAEFNKIYDAEDDILDEWETEARKLEKKSKEVITAALRESGYDGVIIKEDTGSFGRSTDAYIALDPEQVKSATDNIGTFSKNSKDIRYSYVGEFAQAVDRSALEEAEYMEQFGKNSPKEIRDATGWFRGKDGKWRFEISDKDMTIKPEKIPNVITLGELIDHEKLFQQYPDLKGMDVFFTGMDFKGGEYSRRNNDITVSYDLKTDRETLLNVLAHEIQHAIQAKEDFSPGANPGYWQHMIDGGYDSRTKAQKERANTAYDNYDKLREENPELFKDVFALMDNVPNMPRGKIDFDTLEQIEEDPPEWQRFDAERDRLEEKYGLTESWDAMDVIEAVKDVPKMKGRSAEELYRATAGEIEAYDVQGRRKMTDAERKGRFPFLGDGDTVFSNIYGRKYSREMDTLKSLEQQNKMLKQQRDYWKGQTQQTKLKSADQAEVRKLARKIISQYSSQIKSTDILGQLQELADREIRTDADLPFLSGESLQLARKIAREVVQGAGVNVNADQAETLKELKQFLRDARINVDESIKKDIADFTAFKKQNRAMHFREDGSGRGMDSLWLELQDQFGKGYFPDEIQNPSDQIQHVAEVMAGMGENIQNPYAGNMELTIEQMAYSILNDVQKINPNKPTKVDQAIERTQQKLDALIQEGTTREKARVERASQTELRQKIRNISDKFERMALHPGKGATQHAPANMLKSVVDFCQILNASDMARQTRWERQIEAKGEQLAEMLAKENPKAEDIRDYKKLERAAERNSKAIAKLQNLKAQYAALKTDMQYQISYDEAVDNMLGGLLENLANSLVEGDIYELSSRELRDVYHTMTAMLYTVVNANMAFSMGKDKEISSMARKMAGEMWQVNHKAVGLGTMYQRYLQWQMSPDTFFNYLCGFIKDNEGKVIQKAFVNGEDKMLSVQREFYQTFAEFTETKDSADAKELRELMNYNKKNLVYWGMKDQAGNEVKTTRGMMLQAYMMLEQGASIRSLAIGGFALPNAEQYYKGNVAAAYGDAADLEMVSKSVGKSYMDIVKELKQIRAERENLAGVEEGYKGEAAAAQQQHALQALEARERELMDRGREIEEQGIRQVMTIKAEIEKQLTQQERRLIETAHAWYARTGEMMQDVFEGMYGYRPYVVENYVPIHRDLSFVKTDIRDMAAAEKALNLENSGFTIERVKSVAPILLTDFFEELGRQKDQMARYVGFAQVQKDFGKIWKFQVGSNGATISTMVRGRFGAGKTTLGVSGEEYVNHYIADVAGGHKEDSILNKFYGNYAAATLRFNPRVAVSQIASIPTAASVVGWGAMAKGVTKGLKNSLSTQYRNELAEKNAWFYQRYKGQGGSTELADLKNRGGVIERMANSSVGKKLFNWCQNFDVFATGSIMWEAAEAAVQQSGMSKDAEGYEAAVNEKYTEIIRKSQPNYTTTERADLLRDQRGGMKLLTMFKTQSSQNLNLLMEASGEFNRMKVDLREGRNGVTAADVKAATVKLANAYTGVFLGGTVAFVAIRTIMNFIMGAVNPYRDKDTDEVTAEATIKGIGKEMLSSAAGMVALGGPVYDVIMSIISGDKYYGLTDTAIDSISSWMENTVTVIQNAKDEDKEVTGTQIWNMVNGFCNMTGIPANNAKKLCDMVMMYYTDIQGGTFGQFTHDSTSNNQYRARIVEHYIKGNTKKADDAMAMLFAKSTKDTDEEIRKDIASGMRTYLKNEYIKSNVTDMEAEKILKYTGSDDPAGTVAKWDFQLAEPDVEANKISDKMVSAYNNRGTISSKVFMDAYFFASSCEGDKDKDGNTISGSKKQKIVEYIQKLPGLSKAQKKKLFELLGAGSIKGTPWE